MPVKDQFVHQVPNHQPESKAHTCCVDGSDLSRDGVILAEFEREIASPLQRPKEHLEKMTCLSLSKAH